MSYDELLQTFGDGSDHLRGASNTLVHSLPLEVVTSSFSETCSICLCEFEVGEKIRRKLLL